MGYWFSVQKSLGFSPYFLLFGRHPRLPGSALLDSQPPSMEEEDVADMIIRRAEVFRSAISIAMGNLEIAQHRDKLWYSRRRKGNYQRPEFEF